METFFGSVFSMIRKEKHSDSCCMPIRDNQNYLSNVAPFTSRRNVESFVTSHIPGGIGLCGTNSPQIRDDGESPLKKKKVKPFRIGVSAVTNKEFAEFVEETGYITDAERFGWSFVFWSQVAENGHGKFSVSGAEWWKKVDGANWRNVLGNKDWNLSLHLDHPVVHVSWNDSSAYAKWAGGRLPTELEWEHAARAGLGDVPYPWGNSEPNDSDTFPCNIWQGDFPISNTAADGWATTAPVKSFEPNAYGLYNMVGNVWEWTVNSYHVSSLKKQVRQRLDVMRGFKVLKGGSFLCHKSYCFRYRIAARTGNSPDSTTSHQGFRVVWDI